MSSQPRWSCPLCRRTVAYSAFKRHVNAHEKRGLPKFAVDQAWVEFINATGWPSLRSLGDGEQHG